MDQEEEIKTPLESSEQLSDHFYTLVAAKMAEATTVNPKLNRNFRYLPGSAAFFYPYKPWREAIESMKNTPLFKQIFYKIEEMLSKTRPKTAQDAFKGLSQVLEEQGLLIRFMSPQTENIGEYAGSYKVTHLVEGDFSKPSRAVSYKDPKNKEVIKPCILVNMRAFSENPIRSLITVGHELGHYIEEQTPPGDYEGAIDGEILPKGIIPDTEALSALSAMEMARLLYARLGEDALIKYARDQALLYERVMGGWAPAKPNSVAK